MSAFFLWCIKLVGDIGSKMKMSSHKIVLAQYMLAFNPFLLSELVVNAHNDSAMIALSLLAIVYLSMKRYGKGIFALVLSVGIKYVTAAAAPIFFLKKISNQMLFMTIILLTPVIVVPARFQPWYLTWSLIPAVLIRSKISHLWIMLASLGGLIFYLPYISTGFWNNSFNFVAMIIYLPVILSFIYFKIRPLSSS